MSAAGRTILVTGASDALGAALEARWRELGGDVVLAGEGIRDEAALRVWAERCDLVVQFAGVRVDGAASPEDVLDARIIATRAVLRACVDAARPVILVGTSEVYGGSAGLLHERSPRGLGSPLDPRAGRATAALAAEDYAVALGRRGLRFIIARYCNVYGPAMDQPGRGGVIGRFAGCIREGRPLPLADGGQAVRSFCFVDDAIAATTALAESLLESDAVAGRAFNVGRHEPVSIAHLAKRMVRLANHAAGVQSVPGDQLFGGGFHDVPYRVADLTALREAIGFEAPTALDDGLRHSMAQWELLAAGQPDGAPPAAERIPWLRPIFESDETLLTDIQVALATGRVTNDGLQLREFERRLAGYLGIDDCAVVSSGSAALLLTILALGLEGGTAVLPSFTFMATLNVLVHSGLTPIFCDIDPDTWTLCPRHLTRILAADPAVRLVVPVNVFGVPPDMRAIRGALNGTRAALLLDNAHGLGTVRYGMRVAPEASMQTFSLHATKTLPAIEGGVVVASDPRLLAEIRRLRNHGIAADPLASSPGVNAKMSELHAAVGLRSLQGLDAALARRRRYADRIRRVLSEECAAAFTPQAVPDSVQSNFQNFGVRCRAGEAGLPAVQAALDGEGVETRRYFWPLLHHLAPYRDRFSLPVTDEVATALLCLPLHSRMEPSVLDRIEAALLRTASRCAP